MKGAALEKGIEFHLLQSAGCAEALLIARGDVTGSRFALGFGLGAFKDDDLAWHGWKFGGRGECLNPPLRQAKPTQNLHRRHIFRR